jgi:hypothetical protein
LGGFHRAAHGPVSLDAKAQAIGMDWQGAAPGGMHVLVERDPEKRWIVSDAVAIPLTSEFARPPAALIDGDQM